MVQAAASGLIDFSQARFFDESWQRRLRLLLTGLHQANERDLLKARQQYHTSLLGVAGISQESLDRIQERCQDDIRDLENLYRPWAAQTKEEREKEQAREQRTRWQRRFGDLSADETQRKIAETARLLQRMREVTPPRSEMGDWFAVYNRQTSQALQGMQDVKHATARTSPSSN